MSRFKVKLKVTGLELEIEGSREDASMLSRNVSSQLAGLMRPLESVGPAALSEPEVATRDITPSRKQRKARRSSGAKEEQADQVVPFVYDQNVHGLPHQSWKTAEKALWLIGILRKSTTVQEATSKQIVDLFNKHFKEFGVITTSNVSRDLVRLRKDSPALVGQDTNKNPSTFYLTSEGIKRFEKMSASVVEE